MRQLSLWTSSAEDSPAKTSASLAKDAGSAPSAPVSGGSSVASSARSAPATSSSRTSTVGGGAGCQSCGAVSTASGTPACRYECAPLTLAPLTSAPGASWWPTPTAASYGTRNNGNPHDGREAYATKGSPSLDTLARRWPTPTAGDAKSSGARNLTGSKAHAGVSPTDAATRGASTVSRRDRTAWGYGMVLNPRFVEAMMGFPTGWCHLGRNSSAFSATPSSPSARPKRGRR